MNIHENTLPMFCAAAQRLLVEFESAVPAFFPFSIAIGESEAGTPEGVWEFALGPSMSIETLELFHGAPTPGERRLTISREAIEPLFGGGENPQSFFQMGKLSVTGGPDAVAFWNELLDTLARNKPNGLQP